MHDLLLLHVDPTSFAGRFLFSDSFVHNIGYTLSEAEEASLCSGAQRPPHGLHAPRIMPTLGYPTHLHHIHSVRSVDRSVDREE